MIGNSPKYVYVILRYIYICWYGQYASFHAWTAKLIQISSFFLPKALIKPSNCWQYTINMNSGYARNMYSTCTWHVWDQTSRAARPNADVFDFAYVSVCGYWRNICKCKSKVIPCKRSQCVGHRVVPMCVSRFSEMETSSLHPPDITTKRTTYILNLSKLWNLVAANVNTQNQPKNDNIVCEIQSLRSVQTAQISAQTYA